MVYVILFLSAIVFEVALAGCSGAPAPPTVDRTSARALPVGEVVGFTGPYGSHVWRGIPYAVAPVGDLRWRAPVAAPRWKDELQALVSGPPCPQFSSPLAGEDLDATGLVGSEDCLTLDVYAPRRAADAVDAVLPVMVWIHGGPLVGRAGFYDGGNLAATEEVVVVTINYRMGPLGWLQHSSLRHEAATKVEASGSFGLLDQIRALEWVRKNIAAFGGDPTNVTVFGEGFGAFSVRNLLLSPIAAGLFQRAVLLSNPSWGADPAAPTENWTDDPKAGGKNSSNEIIARLLVRDGTAPDRAAAKAWIASKGDAQVLAYLRGKTAQEILAAHVDDPESHRGDYPFAIHVHDGTVVPTAAPMQVLLSGAYNQVPVLLGTTRDEIKLVQALSPEFVEWRLGLFPRAVDPARYEASAAHHANSCKASTVDAPAAAMRAQMPKVYAFRFDWDEEPKVPFLFDGPLLLGAAHGFTGPFVFGHFDLGPQTFMIFGPTNRSGREELSQQMMSYWTEFAENGAPGRGRHGDLPAWTPWELVPEAPKYMLLDTATGGGLRMASDTYTVEDVIAALRADPRITNVRDRCAVLAQWGCVSREQYAVVEECGAYPRDQYPW